MGAGKKRWVEAWVHGSGPILYHIVVVALSAGIAFSLPYTVSALARNVLVHWALIENEKAFLLAVEVTLAVVLIVLLSRVRRNWENRQLARIAREAGIVHFAGGSGFLAQRRIRRLKEKQGFARDVLVIGSTGFRTFVDPKGDLHRVLRNCREAKIMLLHPCSEGARVRAQAILHPDVTPERLREQIRQSIAFLKGLKAAQRSVRLKLYEDVPFLKLAILGDHLWLRYYHASLDVEIMPEYMFEHGQNPGSLYTPFYQYFVMRWEDPGIPEYDLETDEFVYRDSAGNEVRREKLDHVAPGEPFFHGDGSPEAVPRS